MYIDEKIYREANLTVFASYQTEALIAMAAKSLSEERTASSEDVWNVESVCRAMNYVFLSGGRSGNPRNLNKMGLNSMELRRYYVGLDSLPEELKSYTPTNLQLLIIRGE
jgi:hypothetical protein